MKLVPIKARDDAPHSRCEQVIWQAPIAGEVAGRGLAVRWRRTAPFLSFAPLESWRRNGSNVAETVRSAKQSPFALFGAIYRSAAVPRLVTRSKVKTCSWGASTQQPKRRRRS